jgi:hypothetical protein
VDSGLTEGRVEMAKTGERREVLGLYRKRSGRMRRGQGMMPNAGPFSIERLEVSRFGSLSLCVLNRRVDACEREIDREESVNAAA